MNRSQQLQFGPYKTPRFKFGDTVTCELRGAISITGFSDGRIPWPIGRPMDTPRLRTIVLYGALVDAVWNESSSALCYWFGVSTTTVTKWRHTLGVPRSNPGSSKLWSRSAQGAAGKKARAVAVKVLTSDEYREACRERFSPDRFKTPAARRSYSNTRRGVNYLTQRSIAKQIETKIANGGKSGRGFLWSNAEDLLLRTMTPAEVAAKLGRSMLSVYKRRQQLGITTPRKQK